MNADRIDVSRDEKEDQWLFRIHVGEEVIRRHCKQGADADERGLRAAAIKAATDDGYSIDPANIFFQ